jgi:alkylation response protein AidB-like acyl-CoA dehydrogenase
MAMNGGSGAGAVLARIERVLPVIRAAADRIEAARELPVDVLAAIHEARLFRLLLPHSLGGDELDLATHAAAVEAIATADASAAWVVGQGAGCAMAAAYLDPAAARRLFGPADAVLAWGAGIQGKATRVAGGYRLSGTWQFASGSRHATLLGGHSWIVDAAGAPALRVDGRKRDATLLFPRAAARIEDVWQVMGLRGTGSDTFTVTDLFVPDHACIDREEPGERREAGTLYRFSASLAYAAGFAGLMLGLARRSLDDLRQLALVKTPRGATSSLRDSPVFQTDLAKLEARYRAARAYLQAALGEAWQIAEQEGSLAVPARVDIKLATTFAIHEGASVVVEAHRAAGQTAIFTENGFERRLRDALTASQQTQARITNFLTAGRVLMDLEPDTTMFL